MVMLLGSRGRVRRSSFGKRLRGALDAVLGRTRWREERLSRPSAVPLWAAGALGLVAFALGYLFGGGFSAGEGSAGLNIGSRTPSLVDDAGPRPLANQAFIVAIYHDLAAAAARERADALAKYLQENGLAKARPYARRKDRPADEPLWMVVVYYDREAEQTATRDLLLALPSDVADSHFRYLRNAGGEWPSPRLIE
jgi:hypothetical protein